ncbi:hypothetical protein BH11PSE8_BH11PSE8_06480 [soil metagenome]
MDGSLPIDSLEEEVGQRLLKIRAADSSGQRSSASILIHRMYATRGYLSTSLPEAPNANRITLTASNLDVTIGTITVGFDCAEGLLVDELFSDEVNAMRNRGRRICEFTKLAMDSVVKSKRALASLFHVAFIYAFRLRHFNDLLIEVNPRHVRYYERMLGFEARGPTRLNRRVNAPAVLMSLSLSHCQDQILKYGGRFDLMASEKSLYPFCFSVSEEAGIVGRLQRT